MSPKKTYVLYPEGVTDDDGTTFGEQRIEPICSSYYELMSGFTYWLSQGFAQAIVITSWLVRTAVTEVIVLGRIGSRSKENRMIILPCLGVYIIAYCIVPMLATWDFTKGQY